MPDMSLLTLTLKCEVAEDAGWHSGASVNLTFELLERDAESVRCRLSVAVKEVVISDIRSIFVSELGEFAEALNRLRKTLEGSVRLYDFDGDPILTFTVVDQGRGRIAVGGNFHPLTFFSKTTTSDQFVSPNNCGDPTGVHITFEGFVCEQSYLPDLCLPIARRVGTVREDRNTPLRPTSSIQETVNPYDSFFPTPSSSRPSDPKNPAKPLMLVMGGMHAVFAPLVFLAGFQAGLHLVVGAILMLILASATIWLALRIFTPVSRVLTMVWSVCLVAFFAYAAFAAYDPSEIGGPVFYGLMLLIVTPVPILAFLQKSVSVPEADF